MLTAISNVDPRAEHVKPGVIDIYIQEGSGNISKCLLISSRSIKKWNMFSSANELESCKRRLYHAKQSNSSHGRCT
jgi:hypothetical protein